MAASPLDNMRGLEYYLHDIMHAGNDVQEQQGKGKFSIFYKCVPPLFLFLLIDHWGTVQVDQTVSSCYCTSLAKEGRRSKKEVAVMVLVLPPTHFCLAHTHPPTHTHARVRSWKRWSRNRARSSRRLNQ